MSAPGQNGFFNAIHTKAKARNLANQKFHSDSVLTLCLMYEQHPYCVLSMAHDL